MDQHVEQDHGVGQQTYVEFLPPGSDHQLKARGGLASFLRQPGTLLHPLQGRGNAVRMRQDLTEILPHDGIQLRGGDVARRTGRFALGLDRLGFARTDIIGIAMIEHARSTGCGTAPTTYQGA